MARIKQQKYVFQDIIEFEDENGVVSPVTFEIKITPEDAQKIKSITNEAQKVEMLDNKAVDQLKELLFNGKYSKIVEAFGEYYAEEFLDMFYLDFLLSQAKKNIKTVESATTRYNNALKELQK